MTEYTKHLTEPWFSLIKLGIKKCEGRLKEGDFAEIKKGDYFIDLDRNKVIKWNMSYSFPSELSDVNKKIIATTNNLLSHNVHYNDGTPTNNYSFVLPQPSQSFINKYIEEYNKGNKIEDVLVEYDVNLCNIEDEKGNLLHSYDLKINSKDAFVIEDSERGLIAAQGAQCDALWIKTYLTDNFSQNHTLYHHIYKYFLLYLLYLNLLQHYQ